MGWICLEKIAQVGALVAVGAYLNLYFNYSDNPLETRLGFGIICPCINPFWILFLLNCLNALKTPNKSHSPP